MNLAHAAWGPLSGVMGGVWLSGLFNSAFMLLSFAHSDRVLRRLTRPRSVAVHSAAG